MSETRAGLPPRGKNPPPDERPAAAERHAPAGALVCDGWSLSGGRHVSGGAPAPGEALVCDAWSVSGEAAVSGGRSVPVEAAVPAPASRSAHGGPGGSAETAGGAGPEAGSADTAGGARTSIPPALPAAYRIAVTGGGPGERPAAVGRHAPAGVPVCDGWSVSGEAAVSGGRSVPVEAPAPASRSAHGGPGGSAETAGVAGPEAGSAETAGGAGPGAGAAETAGAAGPEAGVAGPGAGVAGPGAGGAETAGGAGPGTGSAETAGGAGPGAGAAETAGAAGPEAGVAGPGAGGTEMAGGAGPEVRGARVSMPSALPAAHRIAVVGGGPGGLYAAALLKRLGPEREITVWERNAPDDTFGFGVVLSDETLGGIEHADPVVYAALQAEFVRWDDIDIVHRGSRHTSGGHGFAALGRRRLLGILHERCRDLGVDLRFRAEAPPAAELSAAYDLVIAADGVHSLTREAHADAFGPSVETHRCRYIWLAADFAFDAFRFEIAETEHGVMQLHGYPFSTAGTGESTVIVEMREEVWQAAGFAELDEEESAERCAKIFADALGGRALRGNKSAWINFRTVVNKRWSHGNTVLLGDAAHTAHFSIGSGTKLAVEDALALAACLEEQPGITEALAAYETERRPVVESTQRAARASLEWFERLPDYLGQPPRQFAFNLLTRSRRVTHDNLRLRDAHFTESVERDFGCPEGTPPMFTPFRLRDLTLRNRVVVSPMDMYSAADGVPGDFHLVHLGARALGGAGLVMTEMVCVSERGRITPGCAGLYTDEQADAWRRITDFAHAQAPGTAIGVQLGHSGRKGSTKLMWEGIDEPLDEGNWPLVAPSPLPYKEGSQRPHALDRAGLTKIREEFVSAARRAEASGFDLLELHCAHGYLLSGFLSPLTNHRTDEYGGSLTNRLRFPLEVFDAIRELWPDGKPMTVRISATDWADGGATADDAVEIARAFAAHGADAIDVSTGQVVSDERPAYGRSYQTPFADRIRNETGVPVLTVGAISSWDDVNSLILAGRTDLCALARPHLYDPHWTLHAAAEQGYAGPGVSWPKQYGAGSRRPQTGRTDAPKPRLKLGG